MYSFALAAMQLSYFCAVLGSPYLGLGFAIGEWQGAAELLLSNLQ